LAGQAGGVGQASGERQGVLEVRGLR